jgi:hypothetical protein
MGLNNPAICGSSRLQSHVFVPGRPTASETGGEPDANSRDRKHQSHHRGRHQSRKRGQNKKQSKAHPAEKPRHTSK